MCVAHAYMCRTPNHVLKLPGDDRATIIVCEKHGFWFVQALDKVWAGRMKHNTILGAIWAADSYLASQGLESAATAFRRLGASLQRAQSA